MTDRLGHKDGGVKEFADLKDGKWSLRMENASLIPTEMCMMAAGRIQSSAMRGMVQPPWGWVPKGMGDVTCFIWNIMMQIVYHLFLIALCITWWIKTHLIKNGVGEESQTKWETVFK